MKHSWAERGLEGEAPACTLVHGAEKPLAPRPSRGRGLLCQVCGSHKVVILPLHNVGASCLGTSSISRTSLGTACGRCCCAEFAGTLTGRGACVPDGLISSSAVARACCVLPCGLVLGVPGAAALWPLGLGAVTWLCRGVKTLRERTSLYEQIRSLLSPLWPQGLCRRLW